MQPDPFILHTLGGPDRWDLLGETILQALLAAFYIVATTNLGCRAGKELVSMTNEAFIIGQVGAGGVPEFIELDESWVSKNRSGNDPNILES